MAMLLDGRIARKTLSQALKSKISRMRAKPRLAIIQVGSRPESDSYISQKKLFGQSVGVDVDHYVFPESVDEGSLKKKIDELNQDDTVSGILVQLPIPGTLDRVRIINTIHSAKDVDGLTDTNINLRKRGTGGLVPATARGILELLEFYDIPIAGKKVAVIGRSALVGSPTAEAFRLKGSEVTVCHSQTNDIQAITRQSDIIVVAIGRPKFVGADYFSHDKTQAVVDVGITVVTKDGSGRLTEEVLLKPADVAHGKKLVGDVDFESVKDLVGAISPVPGGVGPMTILALFENLAETCSPKG